MKKKIKYLIYDFHNEKVIRNLVNLDECKTLEFRQWIGSKKKYIFFTKFMILNFLNLKLMKIIFLDGFLVAYVYSKIQKYKPKIILTTTDNDIRFYKLKKYFINHCKFIAIQNGVRSKFHDIFDNPLIIKDKHLAADYYFSFGSNLKKLINKYIKVKVIPTGSTINNMIKISSTKSKINTRKILYLSSFRIKKSDEIFDKSSEGHKIYWKDFIKDEKKLLKLLGNYCLKYNLSLDIAGTNTKFHNIEKQFFRGILTNVKWNFCPKVSEFSNYELLDKYEIIVNCCSTLGYEALGRDKKVAFFSREISPYNDWRFGWPEKYFSKGIFYSNAVTQLEVNRIMNNLKNMKKKTWKLILIREKNKNMIYDFQNKIIKNYL